MTAAEAPGGSHPGASAIMTVDLIEPATSKA